MVKIPSSSWRDTLVAGLFFAGTVLYWTALPHSLGPADESVHLYEAKRVLDGEVLYRDVFNFITPGWFYLMAALFWLFGTSIETARIAMAVIHGATTVLVYFTGRRLRHPARAGLAAGARLPGHLPIGLADRQPALGQHPALRGAVVRLRRAQRRGASVGGVGRTSSSGC